MKGGAGAFAGLKPDGTITLRGTLGLETGVNTFSVDPQPGDEICFGDD